MRNCLDCGSKNIERWDNIWKFKVIHMTISDKLLKELVCPKCRGPLEFQKAENRLICRACQLAYAISDDVPVMLIDEATPVK